MGDAVIIRNCNCDAFAMYTPVKFNIRPLIKKKMGEAVARFPWHHTLPGKTSNVLLQNLGCEVKPLKPLKTHNLCDHIGIDFALELSNVLKIWQDFYFYIKRAQLLWEIHTCLLGNGFVELRVCP